MLASSTRITSLSRWAGVLLMTLWTVRKSADAASLWKHIMTLVVGRALYPPAFALHLKEFLFLVLFVLLLG